MAKHIKPDDPKQWMRCFNNFFLIRNPKEIILSYHKVCKKVTKDDIGMEHLYYLFKDVQSLTGVTPVVIDSTDLIKNPSVLLKKLCDQLGLQYSDKMLKWESGFKGKTLEFNNPFPWLWTGKLPPTIWYENINQSTGFKPLEEKEKPLPDELKSVFEDCLPFYEKLSRYRITVNECDSIVSA
jgi:hypothetical protein